MYIGLASYDIRTSCIYFKIEGSKSVKRGPKVVKSGVGKQHMISTCVGIWLKHWDRNKTLILVNSVQWPMLHTMLNSTKFQLLLFNCSVIQVHACCDTNFEDVANMYIFRYHQCIFSVSSYTYEYTSGCPTSSTFHHLSAL